MSIEYDDDGGGGGLVCFAQHDGERRRVLFANKIFYFLGLAVVVLVKFMVTQPSFDSQVVGVYTNYYYKSKDM